MANDSADVCPWPLLPQKANPWVNPRCMSHFAWMGSSLQGGAGNNQNVTRGSHSNVSPLIQCLNYHSACGVSPVVFAILDSKVLGSRPWPFRVMQRHRSRDHSIPPSAISHLLLQAVCTALPQCIRYRRQTDWCNTVAYAATVSTVGYDRCERLVSLTSLHLKLSSVSSPNAYIFNIV